jgi:hypothetical protein
MWEVEGDPLPEGVVIPPTSNDLRGALYVFAAFSPFFHRAFYLDSAGSVAIPEAKPTGWPQLRLEQTRTWPGWSGSPVFNQHGATVGIHIAGGGAEPISVITVPAWWTCDRR